MSILSDEAKAVLKLFHQ